MSAIIALILIIVIVLAIIGMGLPNFIASVFKGFEKIKNSPIVKNLTETSTTEVNKIINSNG
jgi:hypothetical protein